MKVLLLTLLSLIARVSISQHLDTIAVSATGTTYLIFDEPITLFNLGTKHYVGKIENEKMIFLKASVPNAEPTTLLVQAGSLLLTGYIRTDRKPAKAFYDYRASAQPTAPKPNTPDRQPPGVSPKSSTGSNTGISTLMRMSKAKANCHISEKQDGIHVVCNQLFNDTQHTYLKLAIQNKTTLPFIIDLISFTYKEKLPKRMRNKVSPQFEERQPDEKIEPARVDAGRTEDFYYSLPVYSTTLKGYLEIIVREQTGARVIVLTIPSSDIQEAPLL